MYIKKTGLPVTTLSGITSEKIVLEKENLRRGIYFYQLNKGSSRVAAGTVMVE